MGELRIRAAVPSDAEALAVLQADASLAGLAHVFPPDRYPFPHEEVRERWRVVVVDAGARVLVAEEDGVPVGVAAVRVGWLDGFYVAPSRWGSDVAPELHDAALEAAAALGASKVRLWVLEENSRARRFYERRGWRENGETRVVPFPPNPIDVGYTRTLGV
jgi:RimJ/RimL family protein N-acetyltransferase